MRRCAIGGIRVNDTELREAVKKGALSGGYLLFGDEDFLKHRYAADMCDSLCAEGAGSLNAIRLDGDTTSPGEVAEAVSSFPVMAEKKAVLLRAFPADALSEREFAAYVEAFSAIGENPQTVLAVSVNSGALDAGAYPKRPSARLKKLLTVLTPVEFSPKPPAVLKKWIARNLAASDVEVMPDALDAMLDMCGSDMYTLHGEAEKLAAYAKTHENRVTADTVAHVCCESGTDDAFALANAVLAGNRGAALSALSAYKERRDEPIAVCAALSRVLCDMLNVCVMQADGASKADIAAALKIHEYKCALYIKALAGMEPGRLRAAVERCAEADRLLKASDLKYIALERLICTIPSAGARRKKDGEAQSV